MTGRLAHVMVGTGTALAVQRALLAQPSARWDRTNHRGGRVSLSSGPALGVAAVAASMAPLPARAVAGLSALLLGAYDDVAGAEEAAKGFRGHLASLRAGSMSAGAAKLLGISGAGLLAARSVSAARAADVVLGGAMIAGTANLLNLLDLRPGRALKVGLVLSAAAGDFGVAAACAAVLPGDLQERTMLGDAGANALGAVIGVRLAQRLPGRGARAAVVAALVGLTAASERVSFSAVIDRTPPLRWLDRLGRVA